MILAMNDGWIKLHRRLLDHPRFNESAWVHLWATLLLLATHKPIKMVFKGSVIELMPGQLITSRVTLSQKTGIHRSSIERYLEILKNEQQIEQQTSNVNRLITILNWDEYQSTEHQTEQPASNQRAPNEQPASTNKNVKNVRTEEVPPISPVDDSNFYDPGLPLKRPNSIHRMEVDNQPKKTVWHLKTQLDVVENQIKSLEANGSYEDAWGRQWRNADDKEEYRKLGKKRAELMDKISSLPT